MVNLHERMLPTSAGVEPATSRSPVRRRIQLSHRGRPQWVGLLPGQISNLVSVVGSSTCTEVSPWTGILLLRSQSEGRCTELRSFLPMLLIEDVYVLYAKNFSCERGSSSQPLAQAASALITDNILKHTISVGKPM